MIHGVFISKKRKRERIYFPNMKEFLEYAIQVWNDLEFLSADTVRDLRNTTTTWKLASTR